MSSSPAPIPAPDGGEVRTVDAGKVADTRSRLPDAAAIDSAVDLFKALGDGTRARIVYALLDAGEMCVCDLAATVDAAESTVSHALRWLRGAHLVRVRRSGRMMIYGLGDEHVGELLEVGRRHHTAVHQTAGHES